MDWFKIVWMWVVTFWRHWYGKVAGVVTLTGIGAVVKWWYEIRKLQHEGTLAKEKIKDTKQARKVSELEGRIANVLAGQILGVNESEIARQLGVKDISTQVSQMLANGKLWRDSNGNLHAGTPPSSRGGRFSR